MNIFIIDRDPVQAARWLVDRHTVKMVLESAQMLANCFDPEILEEEDCPRTKSGSVRKHSYYNHPCSKWVRESRENMLWLCRHAIAIDEERLARYGTAPHSSLPFIKWAMENIHRSVVPRGGITKFAQAMPDVFKHEDPVVAYRNYYRHGKKHLHQWKRNKPEWLDTIE